MYGEDSARVQRRRQDRALADRNALADRIFFDRSPECTLALSHFLGCVPSRSLGREVDRILADGSYEKTVFFIRNQGFILATAARRISFADSLAFERVHEQTYRALGFELIDIPAGPLAGRVALILPDCPTRPWGDQPGSPLHHDRRTR